MSDEEELNHRIEDAKSELIRKLESERDEVRQSFRKNAIPFEYDAGEFY